LDQNVVLLVAEEEYGRNQKQSAVIAVSHASFCPNKKNVWLEGIRVDPNFRRRSVATQLLNKMISYGKKQGAREASAMVADNNIASQLMMERNGFAVISKWSYYSIGKIPKREITTTRCKIATLKDIERICNYLRQSQIFKSSGERYVNSWRWYSLDLYSNTLADLIKNEKVLVIGDEGVAIIDKDKFWNRNNNAILQIVYLDASNVFILEDFIGFVLNLIHSEGAIYDRIQVYSPQTASVSKVMEKLEIERSDQFLIYKREM
jgi:GNAT superfamily N-acetyltransferase